MIKSHFLSRLDEDTRIILILSVIYTDFLYIYVHGYMVEVLFYLFRLQERGFQKAQVGF